LWFEARNEFMRDTTRSQQLSYVEEMANELGFELMKQKLSRLAAVARRLMFPFRQKTNST